MSAEPAERLAVAMRGVSKRYPRVLANQDASLSVRPGEVHALVGENGAGKSTLMKILYGVVRPDQGTISVGGRPLAEHTVPAAIKAGVGMVFQHFMLVPTLSVADNLVLGREPRRGLSYDRGRAEEETRAVAERFGLPIDPRLPVERCSVGLQQRVEILKVLHRGAEVIILDEPTAVLTPAEADELVLVMRRLAGEGKAVILITHKLREVMAAADRITIMRRGRTLETVATREVSLEEVAARMVGRDLRPPERPAPRVRGGAEPVLSVRGLHVRSRRGLPAVNGVDLSVEPGEIVGLAAVEGNGQSELLECLAGLLPAQAGQVWLAGQDMTRAAPRRRLELGLGHVAEDRHQRAVVLPMTLEENAILGSHRRFFGALTRQSAAIRAHTKAIIAKTGLTPDAPEQALASFSGGNQQKLVVGRELLRRPKLLLAAHPTRGLDVGAIEFVQRALLQARAEGTGVLLSSAELSELLLLADRLLVLFAGRVVGELDPRQVDEARLGALLTGQEAR